MDIKQIRLRKLRLLIGEAGTIANLARLSHTAPAYLSQILNSLPTSTGRPRSVGDKLARKLETAMEKPYGWMDQGNQEWSENSYPSSKMVHFVPLINEPDIARYSPPAAKPADGDVERIPIPIPISQSGFAVKVSSDAMEPKFPRGDIIIVDPSIVPQDQDYVLILDTAQNTILFRQLVEEGELRLLKPINTVYPTVELRTQQPHKLIGKVVYRGEVL